MQIRFYICSVIDIVIPYLDKGKNSSELRFALRSIEKHLSGYGEIYIIGDLPSWATGVQHIPFHDSRDPHKHEENIFKKIIVAFEHPGVGETVLHFHADHYLLCDFVAGDFPYYWHRTLMEGQRQNQSIYRTTLIRTEKLLRSRVAALKDFDCHCPIVYEKEKFIQAFEGVEWRDYGYGIKSVYCNTLGIEGEPCTDLKITGRKGFNVSSRDWFSSGNSNPEIDRFLSSLYPLKSSYEK